MRLRKRISTKQLRRQTESLKQQVALEKKKLERERERARLKTELFKLKYRRGIKTAKGVWGGVKAGGRGLAAIQYGLKKGTIKGTFPKLKKVRKPKKKKPRKKKPRKRRKVIVKYY